MSKSRAKGTFTETAGTRYALKHGFPNAERIALHGSKDIGDVRLDVGVFMEVKGGHAAEQASEGQLLRWMQEVETEKANGNWAVGFLLTKRAGKGPQNAGAWWTHWWLSDLAALRAYPGDLVEEIRRHDALVRMTFDSTLVQLRAGGFGVPLGSDQS